MIINTHTWIASKCVRYNVPIYKCSICPSLSTSNNISNSLVSPNICTTKESHTYGREKIENINILSMMCSICKIRGGKIFKDIDINNLDKMVIIPDLIQIDGRSEFKIMTCGEKHMFDILG